MTKRRCRVEENIGVEKKRNSLETTGTTALAGLHVAVFLFGLSGLFGKFLDLPSMVIVGGRTFFGALSLFVFLRLRKTSLQLSTTRDVLSMMCLGGLLAFHWYSFFHSIQISTVAIGLLTYSSFPLFTTLLEPWMLKRDRRREEVWLALAVTLGLILVVPNYDPGSHLFRGAIWGVISGASFALLQICNKGYVIKYSGLVIAYYQNFWACILILPLSGIEMTEFNLTEIGLLALLGVGCTGFAHALYINSLKLVSAQFASVIAALEPVYGIAFALLLFNEAPGVKTLIGGAVIIGATIAASRQRSTETA